MENDNKFLCRPDRLVYTNYTKPDIDVRCVYSGQLLYTMTITSTVYCMTRVSGHGGLLVTGDENGAVHLWDINTGVWMGNTIYYASIFKLNIGHSGNVSFWEKNAVYRYARSPIDHDRRRSRIPHLYHIDSFGRFKWKQFNRDYWLWCDLIYAHITNSYDTNSCSFRLTLTQNARLLHRRHTVVRPPCLAAMRYQCV
jgi:WD40 repeat protein